MFQSLASMKETLLDLAVPHIESRIQVYKFADGRTYTGQWQQGSPAGGAKRGET